MNLIRDTKTYTWPRRINGGVQRGYKLAGFSALGGFLFGIPFVGMGIFVAMIGTGNFEVDPSTVHAPYGLITVFGAMFTFAGLLVWSMALRQLLGERRRRAMIETHQSAAITDYPWDIRGYTPSRWAPVRNGITGVILLSCFSAIFGYIGLEVAGVPWWVQLICVLIVLLTLYVYYDTGVKAVRAIRFGASRIAFDNFPYQTDKPVTIKWVPPTALTQADSGSFTLRCVEEFYETTGSGDNRSTTLVHNELWHDTWLLERAQSFHPGEDITIRYEPPQGLPSTALSGDRTIFWEFEVKLKMPGPDFVATYLVPVYGE